MAISRRTAWYYALGGILDASVSSILLVFWNSFLLMRAGIDPQQLGYIVLLVKILDSINDPLLGYFSDNLTSRGRKRSIQIIVALVPVCVFYISLWIIPSYKYISHFTYYCIVAVCYNFFKSMYEINYNSLVAEMTTEYKDGIPLVFKKSFVHASASMIATVIQSWYVGSERTNVSYIHSSAVVAIVGFPFVVWCAYTCKERDDDRTIWDPTPTVLVRLRPAPRNSDPSSNISISSNNGNLTINAATVAIDEEDAEENTINNIAMETQEDIPTKRLSIAGILYFFKCMFRDYKNVIKNRDYMILSFVHMTLSLVVNVLMTTLLLYVAFVLKQPEVASAYILLNVQGGILAGLILYSAFAHYGIIKDKRRALMGTMIVMIINCVLFWFYEESDVIEVIFGICIAGQTIMIHSMLPDTITVGEARENIKQSNIGSYYGFFTLSSNLANAVAIPFVNFTLSWLEFDPMIIFTPGDHTDQISMYLRLLFLILPTGILVVSLIVLYFYDIDEHTVNKALQGIDVRKSRPRNINGNNNNNNNNNINNNSFSRLDEDDNESAEF